MHLARNRIPLNTACTTENIFPPIHGRMAHMRAWRVHEYGHYDTVLRLEDVEPPRATAESSVVRVRAAGLNFADILSIAGKYQVKAPLPFTPGMESVGEVIEPGPGSKYSVGDRLISMSPSGAFGEYLLLADDFSFPVPATIPDADAAALLMTYQTAYFGLVRRGELRAGETLLVHGGAGGVGTAAIQLGKALGATVIATAGGAEKLDVCRRCGAEHVIDYKTEDFVARVKQITDGRGADVILDNVGGDVFDQSLRCIAWEGRVVVCGFAGGRIPQIPANKIMLKNIAVTGIFWGQYQVHNPKLVTEAQETLYRLYAEGKIRPVIYRTFPLDELPAALRAMEGRQSYGKIVLSV